MMKKKRMVGKVVVGIITFMVVLFVVACATEQPAVKVLENPTLQPTGTPLPLSDEQILTQHPDDLDAALEELDQVE